MAEDRHHPSRRDDVSEDGVHLPTEHQQDTHSAWWITSGAVVVAIAVVAGVLIGLNLARRPSGSASAATCGGRQVLRIVSAPEFAPVLERAAKDIGSEVSGCNLVTVTAQEPATTLAGLAASPPDAWVPSSSAWLRLAAARSALPSGTGGASTGSSLTSPRAGPSVFADNPVSLARTPVVVAAPRPFAVSLGWPDRQLTWAALLTALTARQIPRFSMESPLRGTSGLLAVLGVQVAMARTTSDPGIAQMRALTLRARLTDPDAEPAALLERMASETDPAKALRDVGLFPVTEQALWARSHTDEGVPLAALYPSDGLLEADYPLALTTRGAADQDRRDLAARLTEHIRGRDFVGALTERGFRPAAQSAAATGASTATAPRASALLAKYQPPVSMPPQIAETVNMWAQYKRLSYQTLLLVDGSASMNDQVRDRAGKLTTKADLLRAAGGQAAQLFGEDTSVGMWLFATPTASSEPYTVAVPYGPINETINGVARREVMRQTAQAYQPHPTAGTPLFETVLRGVADMRERYQPGSVTLVVVLTDGRDEDSRFSMGRDQFLARLGAGRDPGRPVPVFAIGYGGDADMGVLNDMARLTGGRAVASNDPGDLASAMAKIFLAAHQAR